MRGQWWCWLLVVATAWCRPIPAHAEASSNAAARAAELNAEGLALYEEGAYQDAIEHFMRARGLQPREPVIRKNLATAHAALGAELAETDHPNEALVHFRKALDFDAENAAAYIGLTNGYYVRGEYDNAARVLRQYLGRYPDDLQAQTFLGDLAYRLGDVAEAIRTWEAVVREQPDNAELQERIEKARRELEVETDFRRESTQHFTVRYEGDRLEDAGYHVLRLCGDARRDIGRELRSFPPQPVEVILYTTEQFDNATEQQGHVAGLYDGKIRVRIPQGALDPAYLRRIIYHEYAHLVIGEITQQQCPYWLNEGLAQWLSEEFSDAHRRMLREAARGTGLPSLASLERVDLVQTRAERLFLANATVFATVDYLRSRFSSRYMLDLLEHMGDGVAPETALQDIYRQDYAYLDTAVADHVRR